MYVSSQDARILYTDMVHVSANGYGVVINFLQGLGPDNKPSIVSRVGMSKEHARSLVEVLQRTIDMSDQQIKRPAAPKQIDSGK
jgi:hypothetical protein